MPQPPIVLMPNRSQTQERALDNAVKRKNRTTPRAAMDRASSSKRTVSRASSREVSRSPSPGSSAPPSESQATCPHPAIFSDAFRLGLSSSKPSESDYSPYHGRIIHRALKELKARVIGVHLFPKVAQLENSVELSWRAANREAEENIILDHRIQRLVCTFYTRVQCSHRVTDQVKGIARTKRIPEPCEATNCEHIWLR